MKTSKELDKRSDESVENLDKKVLLRERKRYTSRSVASTRYAALSPDGGGGYSI